MTETFDFDLFIIGAGSGGVRAARIAAALGARVGITEERYFGGTCVNVGCIPKKLFSYAAHYTEDFEDSAGFGWKSTEARLDWTRLVDNKDKEIKRLNIVYKDILEDSKVTIFEQRAEVTGHNSVKLLGDGKPDGKTEHRITWRYMLLAVGGWPNLPPIPGNELGITSNQMFSLKKLPQSMLIVGGGYIGVEFASIMSGLGTRVILTHRGDRLLRGFDEDVRVFIGNALARKVSLRLGTSVGGIRKLDNNRLLVDLDRGDPVETDLVLFATGRNPHTADLGLESAGVALSANGAIQVDADFQTSAPGVYAVGDAIDRMELTPVALAEAEVVVRNLFSAGQDRHHMSYANIPTTVFCHPNIGTVGLTEEQAVSEGRACDTYLANTKPLKHTLTGRDERAFIKMIVEKSTDRVIGLHLISQDAGEIIQGFAVAINMGATKADFDRTLGIHPTLAEELVTMRTRTR
ncbi:MAG: glutathione-disulfide reductase [Pseudohongiellaceae bacterium]